ncbi:E3 ubiquitin-protein ligase [Acorus gramineus]|uniref:RING-type E3 ubiquitin transferase n=1 Tax=Acorus gramineus TaxID=55184 RepID=A0AAV9B6N4_ACOGR|nr:E3 ubiquitin-protein ligase [Acorus gramineus]
MGSVCCRLCDDEFEEYVPPIYRHCVCLRYFFLQLFDGYGAMFQRLDGRSVPSAIQGVTPLASIGAGSSLDDISSSEAFHLVPRPAPFDADPRYPRLQRDGLVSRREKALNHLQEESQTLRRSSSKASHLESTEKIVSLKALYGGAYDTTSSDDEDVCPTCLDEYTPENPKIVTRCAHHFHLGCIYEWMERSENCPICGKEMEFAESP